LYILKVRDDATTKPRDYKVVESCAVKPRNRNLAGSKLGNVSEFPNLFFNKT